MFTLCSYSHWDVYDIELQMKKHGVSILYTHHIIILISIIISMDWFKGKFTGNHGFYMFLPSNIGVSCKISHHPILWSSCNDFQMPCCKVRCKESRKRPELDKLDVSKFHPKPQVDEYGYNDNDIILYVYIYVYIYLFWLYNCVCLWYGCSRWFWSISHG